MEFDSLIIADWPRGLRLAKQLSLKGRKTAYLEISPYFKRPFPLFLEDSKEKDFLKSLGFLHSQEEGFCLLSPEGVYLAKEQGQKKEKERRLKFKKPALNRTFLKENLFSSLAQNLTARVFDFNDSYFSEDSLPLFSDCFLFEPSLRKKQEFNKSQPQITFLSLSLDDLKQMLPSTPSNFITSTTASGSVSSNSSGSSAHSVSFAGPLISGKPVLPAAVQPFAGISSKQKSSYKLLLQKEFLSGIKNHFSCSAKYTFCLSDRVMSLILPDKADFQWRASFFSADLDGYESIIPEHFLGIKQFLFPWCYDNLLSVFQKKGILEVWMRLPIDRDEREFVKKAQENLESFFPGAKFQLKNQNPLKSFYVYGKEILNSSDSPFAYMQNSQDFFQASLAQDIRKEIQLSQTLIEKIIK